MTSRVSVYEAIINRLYELGNTLPEANAKPRIEELLYIYRFTVSEEAAND